MENKKYTDFVIIEYKEKKYIFNPYTNGIGQWHYLSRDNKPAKIAERELQKELNKEFFGIEELPPMLERFIKASKEEREQLSEIAKGWLQLKIRTLEAKISNPNIKLTTANPQTFVPGGMYFYFYDALYKDSLEYWDRFPLMILLNMKDLSEGTGFLGLNIHYLPMNLRMAFLSKLLETKSDYNEETDKLKLDITYQFLKAASDLKEFKPCIKSYYIDKIDSMILPIESHEWIFAAGLNNEKFQKKSASYVWKDSQKIIKKA